MSTNPFEATVPSEEPSAPKSKRFPLIEIIVGFCMVAVLIGLLMPAVRIAQPASKRMHCRNNLKMIGLAMHNYAHRYGSLPPAYTVDADGNRLHSWRTLLLPFLEQSALYQRIDLTKPWDDPENLAAFGDTPPCLSCPDEKDRSKTAYLVVVDAQSCFPGQESVRLKNIHDGLEQTLLVIEVPLDRAVDWMSPYDTDLPAWLGFSANDKNWPHTNSIAVVMADVSVHGLPRDVSKQDKAHLVTRAGGEAISVELSEY